MAVTANGTVEPVSGTSHSNHVSGITSAGGKMSSVAFDDTIREFASGRFGSTVLSTAGQPKGVSGGADGTVFVATVSAVEAVKDGKKVASLKVPYVPSSIAACGQVVAVGAEVSSGILKGPSHLELNLLH
jgi:sugar lactone lactonase YvrE